MERCSMPIAFDADQNGILWEVATRTAQEVIETVVSRKFTVIGEFTEKSSPHSMLYP
jgi:hypothetical protein